MAPDQSLFRKNDYYSRILILILLGVDVVSFTYASKILEFQSAQFTADDFRPYIYISILSWIIASTLRHAYLSHYLHTVKSIFEKHLDILPIFIFIQASTLLLLGTASSLLIPILSMNLYALLFTICLKSTLLVLYRQVRQRYKTRYVIVGYTQAGHRLHRYLQKQKKYGYQFIGYYDDHTKHPLIKGSVKELYQFCLHNQVDQIYLAIPGQTELAYKLSAFADNHFMYFGYVVSDNPLQQVLLPQEQAQQLAPLSSIYNIIGLPN